jgi:hypothetical protein
VALLALSSDWPVMVLKTTSATQAFAAAQRRVPGYARFMERKHSVKHVVARWVQLSGDLFVFVSRRATQMKVLYFDRSGFCIWAITALLITSRRSGPGASI